MQENVDFVNTFKPDKSQRERQLGMTVEKKKQRIVGRRQEHIFGGAGEGGSSFEARPNNI
jgi:hypothetical protein